MLPTVYRTFFCHLFSIDLHIIHPMWQPSEVALPHYSLCRGHMAVFNNLHIVKYDFCTEFDEENCAK